jgi:hypothetical protein
VTSWRAHESRNVEIDTEVILRMRTVWDSIFHSRRPNMLNPEPVGPVDD